MKNQLLQLFIDLVKIDSPTGCEFEMARYVKKILDEMDIENNIDCIGNVIARVRGDVNKEVLLVGVHMDTVEPGRGIVPVVEDDGRIHSKGNTILGADNKASMAAVLWVLKKLADKGYGNNHPLDVVFTVGEEKGNRGALGLDYERIRAKKGYTFDGSDGKIGDIEIATPYYNRLEIWLTGRSSHSMDPELGSNVLPVLAGAMMKIKLGRINERTLVNLGLVSAGTGINIIPGDVEVLGEIRSHDEGELEEVTKGVFEAFEHEAKEKGIEVETVATRENDGYCYAENDDFVVEVKNKMEKIGVSPRTIKVWGCSDANIFVKNGLKILNIVDCGVNSHSVNEEVTVDELDELARVIEGLVS